MNKNCTNCKYPDVLSSQKPCNTCKRTNSRKYFETNKKQPLDCEWKIEKLSVKHDPMCVPTIEFEGVGYIRNTGHMSVDDIHKELVSRLNGHDDRVDVYMDLAKSYCEHDVKVNVNEMYPKLTQLAYQSYYGSHGQYGPKTAIKKVIFNDPATIVLWADGTKTIVKAVDEEFDPEKGLAMAITKKALGNKGNYFNEIKKWTEPYYEEQAKKEPEFNLFEFLTNPNGSFSITFTSDDKEITLNDVVMSKKDAE